MKNIEAAKENLKTSLVMDSPSNQLDAQLGYHSSVCKKITRVNGEVEDLGCNHNLLTNAGKNALRTCLAGAGCGTPTAFTNISGSNCSNGVTATDTTLCNAQDWNNAAQGNCGIAASTGTYRDYGAVNGAWNVTYEWTSTCNLVYINATGLTNNSLLFAENTWTPVTTLNTGDKLNVTWGIWIS